ncbi:MAG: YjbQ family protein [Firmicutes bacterium]|nr:YjbQ family protein [Bacillota bacterium]
MQVIWKEKTVATKSRVQFLDITTMVQSEVANSGVQSGVCYLFVPHTTAGITINENADPDVVRDMTHVLERLIPQKGDYRHLEGNSDAHLKASLFGFSCMIPIVNRRLDLGTWQGVYFCEFDGPRQRRIKIGILTDEKE